MSTVVIAFLSMFILPTSQGAQSDNLEEAHEAWQVMQHEKPGTAPAEAALLKYDHAVALMVQSLRTREGTAGWGKEIQLEGVRAWRLTFDAPAQPGSTRTLALAEFAHCRPAAEVRLHGFHRVVEHGGLGVPVVLTQAFHPPQGECLSATAVLEFPADVPGHTAEARLRFYNPLAVSEIAVGGQVQPLAENLTAALQGTLTDARVEEKGAGKLEASASGEHASRLFFLSRYDKGRVPVVFVHGMLAGPDVWKNCVNEMYADAGLRRRFQPVCFSYPSKLPIPASAARLRELLTQARSRFDAGHENAGFGRMVLVGHSMGGLLARMQVIDSGDDFWRAFFDVSRERLEGEVDANTRHMLQQSFFFKRRGDISTLVFISTPHQGSVLADNGVLRTLVRTALFLPKTAEVQVKAITALPASFIHPASRDLHAWGVGGVENLAAKHPFLQALARHPVEVPFHSIIATRSAPDCLKSSDGIVPYWSAHLDGAASETLVPCSHRCTEKPETVRAVMKILAGVR